MNLGTRKSRTLAAGIGLLMATVLSVGGTFAWLTISKQPVAKEMNIRVSNATVLEIAQAYPGNYLTGPPEVGVNDAVKTRIVDGQTVPDQGVWSRVVDMSNSLIILQEPATFDMEAATLSTIKFDRTGRTDGFVPLTQQMVDDHGIVYFTKHVEDGNYRGEDGKIYTASSSMASGSESSSSQGRYTGPVDVKCAGGVALWMRCNQPTSEEILLKGLAIKKATGSDPQQSQEDNILGVVVNTYHLAKDAATKQREKDNNQLEEGVLEPFNSYYAQKTKQGYVCTIFAGGSMQQMQPGEPYLVEIVFYIEGNTENQNGNTAAVSQNTGESKEVTFDSIQCRDVMYAAKVTAQESATGSNGWYTQDTALKIELFGGIEAIDNPNILISYRLTTKDNPEATIAEDSFKAFDEHGEKQSRTIAVGDGQYILTVKTVQTDDEGQILGGKPQYYTVNIGDTSMVSTDEDSIKVKVDSVRPIVSTGLEACGCTCSEGEYTYHNHSVTVIATAAEVNPRSFRINERRITPATVSEEEHIYQAERLYVHDGKYEVVTVVTDEAGHVNDPERIDPVTGKKSAEVKFIIDTKNPEITDVKWGFVNEGAAEFMHTLTGSMFFAKEVKLEVKAEDEYIDTLTLSAEGLTNISTVKDGDNKHITTTGILPMNFSGSVTITAKDKAGNVETQSTGMVAISDKQPKTKVDQTGKETADGSEIYYDLTYHLTPLDDNAAHVTGFEYSIDGIDWRAYDSFIDDVHYVVTTDRYSNDTVSLYCEDYTAAEGGIYFRAVTDIATDSGSGNIGYMTGRQTDKQEFSLLAAVPDKPGVTAAYADIYGQSGTYMTGTPINGTLQYSLDGGDKYSLDVKNYQYSTDNVNWYPVFEIDKIRTDGGLTYMVTGDHNQYITVTGADEAEYARDIYFRVLSTKKDNPEHTVKGEATEAYSFKIDRKIPSFKEPRWGYVNDDPLAETVSLFTGDLFFNKRIKVQVSAVDTNIDEITCNEFSADNDAIAPGWITATVYVETTFDGTLTFIAVDKAGNTADYTTPQITGENAP